MSNGYWWPGFQTTDNNCRDADYKNRNQFIRDDGPKSYILYALAHTLTIWITYGGFHRRSQVFIFFLMIIIKYHFTNYQPLVILFLRHTGDPFTTLTARTKFLPVYQLLDPHKVLRMIYTSLISLISKRSNIIILHSKALYNFIIR